jgi:hypothetical protein
MLELGWEAEITAQTTSPVIASMASSEFYSQDAVVLALCTSGGVTRAGGAPSIDGIGEMTLAGSATGSESFVELWVCFEYDNVTREITIPNTGEAKVSGWVQGLYGGPAELHVAGTATGSTASPSCTLVTTSPSTLALLILGHSDDSINSGFSYAHPSIYLDSMDLGTDGWILNTATLSEAGSHTLGWTSTKTGSWCIAALALVDSDISSIGTLAETIGDLTLVATGTVAWPWEHTVTLTATRTVDATLVATRTVDATVTREDS